MKPMISYYGGKQRIASKIVEQIWQIPHTVYAEPFAGGLSVLFAKGIPPITNGDHYREVINDHDDFVINLYRVANEQPNELNRMIQGTLYSQSDHRKATHITRNPSQYSSLELAWACYVNFNQSFANKKSAGWRTSVFRKNQAFSWTNKKNDVSQQMNRLKDVHIACEDALRFIERWDSPQTLFYCDPPYPGAHQGHYGGYTLKDWQQLCDALDSCKSSYILSNYPQSIEPQTSQKRIEIKATVSAKKAHRDKTLTQSRGDTKRTEVLWICDRSHAIRDELKGVAFTNLSQVNNGQLAFFNPP